MRPIPECCPSWWGLSSAAQRRVQQGAHGAAAFGHADAACLSAGGCVAFYPTKVPLHYKSKFLGNSDPFGEMVEGCRKLGMNVIARTDPHAVHQDACDAHPEWIAVDAEGTSVHHTAPLVWREKIAKERLLEQA